MAGIIDAIISGRESHLQFIIDDLSFVFDGTVDKIFISPIITFSDEKFFIELQWVRDTDTMRVGVFRFSSLSSGRRILASLNVKTAPWKLSDHWKKIVGTEFFQLSLPYCWRMGRSDLRGHMTVFCNLKLLDDEEGGLSALQENFEDLLLTGDGHDVVFVVQDREFRAHKNVLRARSPVFAAMFSDDTGENSVGTIPIEDCGPEAFGDLLLYVYASRMEDVTPKKALALYQLAYKYDVSRMREDCVEFMKACPFDTDTVCDVIALAVQHDDSDLLGNASSFFSRYIQDVLVTEEWLHFISSNPRLATEMIIQALSTR